MFTATKSSVIITIIMYKYVCINIVIQFHYVCIYIYDGARF